MNMLAITPIFFSMFLTSCSWDPNGVNAQREWLAQKEKERVEYEKQVDENQKNRLKKQKEEAENFEASHPEVEVEKLDVDSSNSSGNELSRALNNLGFVTRYPNSQNMDNVYVKVGGYHLTMRRVKIAITGYAEECKRASAYDNANYKNICISNLTKALNDFSGMLKINSIPDKTKYTALSEASFDSYIDFEHAARLAKMHASICQQKGNKGYVEMVTLAAPCSGRGDVYNIEAARKMGLL
ncbi:TPA: hypothetical protein PBP55_003283 [Escherichia coli]|nr:hypothetical protein [Escherichia coli]HCR8895194.1 hypothetical protein [Escherichia coli]HDD8977813.1 hypothetical protein [Escherichia coli]HDW4032674.1 hypothetical protein [Escherichia coli]